MVEKINILQTQLFIVTKEKQQLEYKNQLLEQENQQLQKLVKSNPKNTQLSHHDSKIDSLVKKYEKIQEHNISQLGKTKKNEETLVSSDTEEDTDSESSTTLSSGSSFKLPGLTASNDDLSSNDSSTVNDHLDVDKLLVNARERKKRLPSVFRKESPLILNKTNSSSSLTNTIEKKSSNLSVDSVSSSSSTTAATTTVQSIREKDKTTNGKLIIEYPVNPIFNKSQQSSSNGKRVTKGARVSLIQMDDLFSELVQGFVVGNDSKLSCEGEANGAAKYATETFSKDIIQQCKEYIQKEKASRGLNEGEVFCSTFSMPNRTNGQCHLIHLFTGSSSLHVIPSKNSTDLDGVNLDSNELTKTKFYHSLSNAVRNALECVDTLECQSIAFAPFLAHNGQKIVPQYGLLKSQWVAAARCFFRSTFEHCIENRLSSTLLDIRFIVTSEEESKILKHHFDLDFQFFIFNFVKFQAQFSKPASNAMSMSVTQIPKEESQKEKDPKDYYDYDFTQTNQKYEEDSPENIMWMESTDEESDQAMEIKCATLDKLIERVTFYKNYDNAYLYAFLLTYRSFTSPHDLMDRLFSRYNLPPPNPKTITKNEFAKWQEEVLQQVRLRVTQVIKFWLENHYHDFENDAELLEKVKKLSTVMENTQGKHFATQLLNSIKRQQSLTTNNVEVFVKIETAVKFPKKYRPGKDDLTKFDILEWPSAEIARQITLIEYNMFKSIRPKECLNQSWNKESREEKAYNIFQMITWFNRVSRWVATKILSEPSLKERKTILTKMIQIAEECRKLNNFNAVFEIVSGLQNSAVHRLKKTWEALKSESRRDHEELLAIISGDNNFRAIRHAILYVKPPCIPYIGVFLTDLTFIEDGNPNVLNDKINFIKRRKLAMLIRDIQTYQQTPYSLQNVPELQERLKNIHNMDEDKLYKLSLDYEPRTKPAVNY
ncbi:hypothetical protein NAEGRDRAFT_50007 [Naegleria gruberi]|nr:uncharacterized protein NAEGRDRAFT_50007 [Naegleria gruberi]EFC43246.1 hypothetical protein NAEGRDRAFT_50007 [Naegleria gruberi]|eukprot:XP_002675990.1 hypothetical protein NAEGRDRAFT_50007 [Naegleria gruberi strain NEG-M]